MKAFQEKKGNSVNSSLKLDSGVLDYHVIFLHDTIYIPGKDSLIYVPVDVPGPVTNELTWWQQLWVNLGRLFAAGSTVYLLLHYLRIRFKNPLKGD